MTFNHLPWLRHQTIAITAHAFVDPDALGSMIALGSFLKKAGKRVTVVAYGGVPANLRFLLGDMEVVSTVSSWADFDLIVVIDSSNIQRPKFPELEKLSGSPEIVNIDHHPDNTQFGAYNYVEPGRSSTAEILFNIFTKNNFPITAFEATALLAGLMGDTGSFKHSNTTPRVYEIAGELLLKGAAQDRIVRNLFAGKTVGQLKAWSYVLEHASHDPETGAIVSGITTAEIEGLDMGNDTVDGVVDILNTFPGASYAAFMRQQEESVKVSLRSESYKGVDVGDIARKFGGGGHVLAAGFSVPGTLVCQDNTFFIVPDPTPQNSKQS